MSRSDQSARVAKWRRQPDVRYTPRSLASWNASHKRTVWSSGEMRVSGYDLFKARRRQSRRDAVKATADRMSLRSYCFNEAVLGSCAFCRGFVLFAAGAFLAEGLLMLLACCSCF